MAIDPSKLKIDPEKVDPAEMAEAIAMLEQKHIRTHTIKTRLEEKLSSKEVFCDKVKEYFTDHYCPVKSRTNSTGSQR